MSRLNHKELNNGPYVGSPVMTDHEVWHLSVTQPDYFTLTEPGFSPHPFLFLSLIFVHTALLHLVHHGFVSRWCSKETVPHKSCKMTRSKDL